MAERQVFQGFFSYSHLDAEVDPKLFEGFTTRLEQRVRARLINADFKIWVDQQRLKTGYKWDSKIIHEVESAAVFILLLTPKWVESEYCKKELSAFLEVERALEVGEYIAPLLARTLDRQLKHFNESQRDAYAAVSERQYSKILSRDFLAMNDDEREILIDSIADDIEGMIERRRSISQSDGSVPNVANHTVKRQLRRKPEFDSRAHNFADTDFMTDGEVYIEASTPGAARGVFASIGFIPKMFIQTPKIRVEFGIQRAVLSLNGAKKSDVVRDFEFGEATINKEFYYINWKPRPQSVSICMNPVAGKDTLQEIPLPPSAGENRLCRVAVADPSADLSQISAFLSVNLSAEGLHVFGEGGSELSPRLFKKIAAIASVAVNKDIANTEDRIERELPVQEKRK